ncbi:MAG: hypothetical protein AAFP89_27210 [Bacteroidota bacterium]
MDEKRKRPKLRTVDKSSPPYPLNKFGKKFPYLLGKEIVYLLATKGKPSLEGEEWEEIFAKCIGAEWKPSNVGLDDVVLGNTAWGAKTVKATKPFSQKKVRLISGRNSIVYSFGEILDTNVDPAIPGEQVLDIWNERVSAVREKFKNLRTIVLVKSNDLLNLVVFEFDTIRYDPELFYWEWNKRSNLEGFSLKTKEKVFTWQPHGSQFTIHEKIPESKLQIEIKKTGSVDKDKILKALGYSDQWIKVI